LMPVLGFDGSGSPVRGWQFGSNGTCVQMDSPAPTFNLN
jgi:uncharacterized membrane protein